MEEHTKWAYVRACGHHVFWFENWWRNTVKWLALYKRATARLWFEINQTKVLSIFSLVESSKKYFIFLPAFYPIMCLMKSPKNFGKIAILKIWRMVSFWGDKTHFGKTIVNIILWYFMCIQSLHTSITL